MTEPSLFAVAHDALNRMRRASQRGTGCHLTAEMIAALEQTSVGSLWNDPDPRDADGELTAASGEKK